MSGVAGIVATHGEIDHELKQSAERMLAALLVKGPDHQASWQEPKVCLLHALFRSTPEQSNERGPTRLAHVVVVADARLDERESTLHALGVPNEAHARTSDSELIAMAYLRWGRDCVHHLHGDFAFALWDQSTQTLFCARDLFAVRPFFFAESARGFVFASTFEALDASGLVTLEPDPVRLYDALSIRWLGFAEVDRTPFRRVMRLPAGYTLTVANGVLRSSRYALLKPAALVPQDPREQTRVFRALFERAVERRLRGIGTVASMLSGGLDSGAIVCLARDLMARRAQGPLVTCSVLNDPPWDEETAYVRAIQAGPNLVANDVTLERMPEFAEHVIGYLEHAATAPHDYAVCQLWLACAVVAQRAGARVMLTGEVGDFALGVSCDPTFRALREGAYLDAVRLPLGVARAHGWRARDMLPEITQSTSLYVQHHLLRAVSPSLFWARRRRRQERMLALGRTKPYVRPLPQALEEELVSRSLGARLFREWLVEGREDHMLAHGADRALGAIGDKWDRVAGWVGVEARHPILDRDLVEFCMAIPWRERMRGGVTKSVLRRSSILPEGHARQGIMENANSFARYAVTRAIPGWVGRQLADSKAVEAWFVLDHLKEVRRRWEAGDRDDEFTDQALEVASYAMWLRRYGS